MLKWTSPSTRHSMISFSHCNANCRSFTSWTSWSMVGDHVGDGQSSVSHGPGPGTDAGQSQCQHEMEMQPRWFQAEQDALSQAQWRKCFLQTASTRKLPQLHQWLVSPPPLYLAPSQQYGPHYSTIAPPSSYGSGYPGQHQSGLHCFNCFQMGHFQKSCLNSPKPKDPSK